MRWYSGRDLTPKDNQVVNVRFPNGNIKHAVYKADGHPKESFWFEGKYFIIKEEIKQWSDECLKCNHLLEPSGECAICIHLM